MQTMKTFLSRNKYVLFFLLFTGTVAVTLLNYQLIRIDGGSMEPSLPRGSIVFVQPSEDLEIGDIITFQEPGTSKIVTHRLIGFEDNGSLQTWGDANPSPDQHNIPLLRSNVMGEMKFAAFAYSFLSPAYWTSARGIASLVIIAFTMITISVVLIRAHLRKKHERAMEIPAEATLEPTRDQNRELTPV